MRTSRMAQQLAEEDAKRPPPVESENGQSHAPPEQPSGPRYDIHRPWYSRFAGKGCQRCGSNQPRGWIQRQIETPYRVKRLALWLVDLLPRGCTFLATVTSRRVQSDQYVERQAQCGTCPAAVIELRVRGDSIRETSYCSACACGRWYLSRNKVRNWRSKWRCPLRRHSCSDMDARYHEYLRTKSEAAARTAENGMAHMADGNGRGES